MVSLPSSNFFYPVFRAKEQHLFDVRALLDRCYFGSTAFLSFMIFPLVLSSPVPELMVAR